MPMRRVNGPAILAGAAATRYTVPAGLRLIVRHIHVSNPSAGSLDITLSIGTDAAGLRVFDGLPIPADSVYDHYGIYVLEPAEIIQAFGGVAMTLTIDGELEAV